jgi:hypothetical protein
MLGIEDTDDVTGDIDEDMEAEQQAFDKLYGNVDIYPPIDEDSYVQKMQEEMLM